MPAGFPLGSFVRGRRDWSIEGLMIGSAVNYGGNVMQWLSLNNNSNSGMYLAVYGILAWRQSYPKGMAAFMQMGADNPVNIAYSPYTSTLIGGVATIAGYLGVYGAGSIGINMYGIHFQGNGTDWLTMGDLPIFVLPPGYQCVATPDLLGGQPMAYEPMAVTFMWGPYARPRRMQA